MRTVTTTTAFEDLFSAIQMRPRPEDVAQLVLEILDKDLTAGQRRIIDQAAKGSLKRAVYSYSSMAQDFSRPVGADKQVQRAALIFKIPDPPSTVECLDVARVEAFMCRIAEVIQVVPDQSDFKVNRLNREQRKTAGLDIKKRQYNKMFRAIRRLKWKIERMIVNGKKYEATRISKSAGATKITLEDLKKDLPTACFVAYLSARMSLRSMFTNASQEKAFDQIAASLFARAKESPTVNWWAIALVHPEEEVLKNLSDEEKGQLLGIWTETMHMLSDMLKELHQKNDLDLKNMIVHKGNDSTTWNAVAGAWNKARDHWISLLFGLRMEKILDHYCPGKVLRLMASDVVQWHIMSKIGYGHGFDWKNQALVDQGLHPDTLVWRNLPYPWRVFDQKEECPRALVEATCLQHGVLSGGWAGPKPEKRAVEFKPTPELVHGVTVSSPFLASILKKAGWFSGKLVKDKDIAVQIVKDPHGFATLAKPAELGTLPEDDEPPVPPAPSGGMAEPTPSV